MSRQAQEYFDDWKRLTPMNRLGAPGVPAAVLFLAAESSSLITGTVLNVDGGYTALVANSYCLGEDPNPEDEYYPLSR